MSVSKPSICFWKWVISNKWRNKLLIHNINLTGHRKSACCLQLLVFLQIWIIALFWHWRTHVFPKGCYHHDLKAFCKIGYKSVLLDTIENMKYKWLVYYLSLLFTHLVKGHWRAGGWNQKWLGNRFLATWFFWLHIIIYDYFSIVFSIVPKKILLLKYQKWVSHLKKRYHYAKVVENARINFSNSLYCTLLFSRKENFKFFEVALSAVLCSGTVGCIMIVWDYQYWNTTNTTPEIYLLFENGHRSTETRCKVTTTIDFLLISVFFINFEHLSHPTLMLLFIQ